MTDYTHWGLLKLIEKLEERIEKLEKRDAERAAKERGDEIHLVWSIEDVRQMLDARGQAMTDAECREVLRQVERTHDASIGVTWDTLDYWISKVISKRKK